MAGRRTTHATRACPETRSGRARFPQPCSVPSVGAMTYEIDIAALIEEIRRYLAAVDAFRAAGCLPTWRPDPGPAPEGR